MPDNPYVGCFTRDGANYVFTAEPGRLDTFVLRTHGSVLGVARREISVGEWTRLVDRGDYRKADERDEGKLGY